MSMKIAAHHFKSFLSHSNKESDNVAKEKKSDILKYESLLLCPMDREEFTQRNTLPRHFEILHHKQIYKYQCLDRTKLFMHTEFEYLMTYVEDTAIG